MIKGVIFDFDLTLYDSVKLENDRVNGDWQAVYNQISENFFYSGVIALIRSLKEKKIIVAIASNAPKTYISRALRYHNIQVDFVVAYHDVKNHKPAPDALYSVLNKFNLIKDEVVYIGDNDSDLTTAESAGISFYGVKWGSFSEKKVTKIDFESFIEEVIYKHSLTNSKKTKTSINIDELIVCEGNQFYLGYYKTKDSKSCYQAIRSKLIKFKNNNSTINRQCALNPDFWTTC